MRRYFGKHIAALILAGLIAGSAACMRAEPASVPRAAPAATPAPVFAGDGGHSPLPAPTDTPIPASAFEETYFRRAGDAPEVVVNDSEHGHWEYRSDALDVRVDCVTADLGRGDATYFLADVHLRDMRQLRGVAASGGGEYPWRLARENRAVLLIAGDGLDRAIQGVRLRNGEILCSGGETGAVAFYPDLSMRIAPPDADADALIGAGVADAFCHGPALVEDGEAMPGLSGAPGRSVDARTGIGMLSPGRFLVVVADGRQPGYSVGLTYGELADIFVEHGAWTAYALQGGRATALVFMGEHLNHHAGIYAGNDPSYQARIRDALTFGASALVPGLDDEVKNDGNRRDPDA